MSVPAELDGRAADRCNSTLWFLFLSRGPDGVQLENANSSVATVTGLQVGTYVFTLTVKDERNLQSQSSVNVIVKEGTSLLQVGYLGQITEESVISCLAAEI